jgi:hypothetical protein
MAERSIIYHLSVQGAQQVKSELDQVRQRFDNGTASLGEMRDAQRTATQTARVFNNEQKISHNLWLAMHPKIRQTSEALGAFNRLTSVTLTAMNAINLAQLVFNQKASGQLEMVNNLKQAERELAIATKNGASEQELANLRENAELARSKMKEFNDELGQQRLSNYFTFAASIGHLASGFGSIVTRSPEIVNLFRRIGGSFFGGSPSGGGGPPPVSGTGSFSRGGFGPPGAPGVGVPTMAGRCVEICNQSQAGVAAKVGSQFRDKLSALIPYLVPIAATAAIVGGIYTLLGSNILNVWVKNFPGGAGATPPGSTPPTAKIEEHTTKTEESARDLAASTKKTSDAGAGFADTMKNLGNAVPMAVATSAAAIIFALSRVGPEIVAAAQTTISRMLAFKIPNVESFGFEHFGRGQEAFATSGGGGSSKVTVPKGSKLSHFSGPFKAASGMHAEVSSPTLILVGESGRERVDISPGGGSGMVTINNFNVTFDQWYEAWDRRFRGELRRQGGYGT